MLAAGPSSGPHIQAPSSLGAWRVESRGSCVPTRHGLLCGTPPDLSNAGFHVQSGFRAGPFTASRNLKADFFFITIHGRRPQNVCPPRLGAGGLCSFWIEGAALVPDGRSSLHALSADCLGGVEGLRHQGHIPESLWPSWPARPGRITCGAKKGAKGGGAERPKIDTEGRQVKYDLHFNHTCLCKSATNELVVNFLIIAVLA